MKGIEKPISASPEERHATVSVRLAEHENGVSIMGSPLLALSLRAEAPGRDGTLRRPKWQVTRSTPALASRSLYNGGWIAAGKRQAESLLRRQISALKASSLDREVKSRRLAILQLELDNLNQWSDLHDLRAERRRMRPKFFDPPNPKLLEKLLRFQKLELQQTWTNRQLLLLRLFGPRDREPMFKRLVHIPFGIFWHLSNIRGNWFTRMLIWMEKRELDREEAK
jgi:hypothetical protein